VQKIERKIEVYCESGAALITDFRSGRIQPYVPIRFSLTAVECIPPRRVRRPMMVLTPLSVA
jgi:hypothetical protein